MKHCKSFLLISNPAFYQKKKKNKLQGNKYKNKHKIFEYYQLGYNLQSRLLVV